MKPSGLKLVFHFTPKPTLPHTIRSHNNPLNLPCAPSPNSQWLDLFKQCHSHVQACDSLVLRLPAIWLLLLIIRFSTFSLFTWSKLVPMYTAVQCMSNWKGLGLFICFTVVSQTPWQHQGSHFYTITYKSYTPFPRKMLPIALFCSYTNKITICLKIW